MAWIIFLVWVLSSPFWLRSLVSRAGIWPALIVQGTAGVTLAMATRYQWF